MIPVQTLEDAVEGWEEVRDIEHSIFNDLKVETVPKGKKQKQHKMCPLWLFATDNRKIMAYIFKPKDVESVVRKTAAKMYGTAYGNGLSPQQAGFFSSIFGDRSKEEDFVKLLNYHNAFSLLIHELFHPLYCPNSSWLKDSKGELQLDEKGKKIPGDKQLIHQAIYQGLKKALPRDKDADLVAKTRNVENTVWDFCIDTFQYYFVSQNKGLANTVFNELAKSGYTIDSQMIDRFPEGIIPLFDVVSYSTDSKLPVSALAATRYMYGLMFCDDLDTRKNLLSYFDDKITRGGIRNLEHLVRNSLKGLTKEVDAKLLRQKNLDAKGFAKEVDKMYKEKESENYDNTHVIETMTSLLMDKKTRYDAIKGFIQPLAHLIQLPQYEQRKGSGSGDGAYSGQPGEGDDGSGSGGGEEDSDDDPSGGNQPGEGEEGSDISDVLDAILAGMGEQQGNQMLGGMAAGQGSQNNPHLGELTMIARDKYYKENCPEIAIKSPDSEAVIFQMGKIKVWKEDYALRVPENELHKHMPWINFGLGQNLPVMVQLSQRLYRVTYFKQEEIDQESYQYQNSGIDVARNWILLVDSSGSMGGSAPGCDSPWDRLLHINYGILKTLYNASKLMNQECDVWVVNFSNSTRTAGPVNLHSFYEAKKSKEKSNLLLPQGGGTELSTSVFPQIKSQLKRGRTVWSFVTDGEIWNANQVYPHIQQLVGQRENCVLYFEMGHQSTMGRQLKQYEKNRHNLQYHSIKNLSQILNTTLEVLVEYS